MRGIARRVGYGIVLWVVPYVCAIPLLPLQQSQPMVFKALMASIATIVASVLAALYFKNVERGYLREAVLLAVTWVLLNWALDFAALLPFSGQSVSQYMMEIGIEYVAFMAPIIAIGYLLDLKTKTTL